MTVLLGIELSGLVQDSEDTTTVDARSHFPRSPVSVLPQFLLLRIPVLLVPATVRLFHLLAFYNGIW